MSGPHPDPLAPVQNLEPAAAALFPFNETSPMGEQEAVYRAAVVSGAISLKRIADKLESSLTAQSGANLHAVLMDMAYQAGREFQRGVEHERRT